MSDQHHRLLHFGPFTVDRPGHCLLREGVRVPLQEQPFQILLALLEAPGQVVTRDALRQRLWGEGTYVDFDQSLNSAIRRLRIALGDTPRTPAYLETMPRLGFRLRATVTDEAPEAKSAPTSLTSLLAAETDLPPDPVPLPQLAPPGAVSHATTPQLSPFTIPVALVGHRRHLASSAVALVTLVLLFAVLAHTQPAHSWSWNQAVPSRPASSTAVNGPSVATGIVVSSSFPPADHQLTELTGWYHLSLRTNLGYSLAQRAFEQAIVADPRSASALAGLAQTQILLALNNNAPSERLAIARLAGQRALALAPNLPDAHTVLGAVHALELWDEPAAEREFRSALALDPHSSLAHLWLATFVLVPEHRYTEAEQEANLAIRDAPLSLIAHTKLGWIYFNEGNHEAALQQYRFVLNLDPTFVPARFHAEQLLRAEGHIKQAVAYRAEDPPGPPDDISLRHLHPKTLPTGTASDPCTESVVQSFAGTSPRMSVLRVAVEHRCPLFIFFGQDPTFLALHSAPEFTSLERSAFPPHP